ncbi:hypothetical protein KKG71_07125 [Patescibacteria group bacterium]|nr:hypothetical protein [Patescibacteria group bacterium]
MKVIFFNFLIAILLATLFCGCAQYGVKDRSNTNLTAGKVKMEIKKGVTTQSEILQIFGSPNIVTKNRDNDEVWNYNRMSYESAYGSDSGGFIFWGGSRAVSSATTKSFDLIIIFDKDDIVKDYSIIAASF